jgi:hypothetical protein
MSSLDLTETDRSVRAMMGFGAYGAEPSGSVTDVRYFIHSLKI